MCKHISIKTTSSVCCVMKYEASVVVVVEAVDVMLLLWLSYFLVSFISEVSSESSLLTLPRRKRQDCTGRVQTTRTCYCCFITSVVVSFMLLLLFLFYYHTYYLVQ